MDALELLEKRIKETRQPREKAVLDGQCKDHAEYKYATGVLWAFDVVEQEIAAIQRNIQEFDEDDE